MRIFFLWLVFLVIIKFLLWGDASFYSSRPDAYGGPKFLIVEFLMYWGSSAALALAITIFLRERLGAQARKGDAVQKSENKQSVDTSNNAQSTLADNSLDLHADTKVEQRGLEIDSPQIDFDIPTPDVDFVVINEGEPISGVNVPWHPFPETGGSYGPETVGGGSRYYLNNTAKFYQHMYRNVVKTQTESIRCTIDYDDCEFSVDFLATEGVPELTIHDGVFYLKNCTGDEERTVQEALKIFRMRRYNPKQIFPKEGVYTDHYRIALGGEHDTWTLDGFGNFIERQSGELSKQPSIPADQYFELENNAAVNYQGHVFTFKAGQPYQAKVRAWSSTTGEVSEIRIIDWETGEEFEEVLDQKSLLAVFEMGVAKIDVSKEDTY